MPGQPVLIAVLSSMKVLVGHKTVLMTELWPKNNMNVNPIPGTQSNKTICARKKTLQY